ncbi:MAG: 5-(carboxyamino)imidazole ribonucleotide synthase [Chloroflexi bacterium]|nr:5-(carboxyamino)imidazole ribonucleotide synthase [Chloroflexota bacterium]
MGPVITPPATIGILGGGQLGRMLGFAAREMGYGIRILDPDATCPAAAIADHVEVGSYSDVEAALRMATGCAVMTYELEHVDALLVEAIEAAGVPVRPCVLALRVTQDRLAERRFVAAQDIAVAPWREVDSGDDDGLAGAVAILGLPIRLKAAFGGYDGRSQVRVATRRERTLAWMDLGRPPGQPVLVERELHFEAELSVICARSLDGQVASFPVARNRHDDGILVESVMPAGVSAEVSAAAGAIAARLAEAMDLVGLLTVELFLMRDGSLIVNELAPRVHNSGHATIEASATSQFEQHIRAIWGLPWGATDTLSPAAMVTVLGSGPRRAAALDGAAQALAEPTVHLHVYGKREVHERRKMGHLTALGGTTDEALERARTAVAHLGWMP